MNCCYSLFGHFDTCSPVNWLVRLGSLFSVSYYLQDQLGHCCVCLEVVSTVQLHGAWCLPDNWQSFTPATLAHAALKIILFSQW